jgi:hemerythrin-like metal-binding protein
MNTRVDSEDLQRLEQQHVGVAQRLEAFAHQLFDASQREAAVIGLLDLITEMSMHFGFEEALMDGAAYPELDHHRRQHMGLVIELGLLLDRVEAMVDLTEVARSSDFLARWYRQHTEHSDGPMLRWYASVA